MVASHGHAGHWFYIETPFPYLSNLSMCWILTQMTQYVAHDAKIVDWTIILTYASDIRYYQRRSETYRAHRSLWRHPHTLTTCVTSLERTRVKGSVRIQGPCVLILQLNTTKGQPLNRRHCHHHRANLAIGRTSKKREKLCKWCRLAV